MLLFFWLIRVLFSFVVEMMRRESFVLEVQTRMVTNEGGLLRNWQNQFRVGYLTQQIVSVAFQVRSVIRVDPVGQPRIFRMIGMVSHMT